MSEICTRYSVDGLVTYALGAYEWVTMCGKRSETRRPLVVTIYNNNDGDLSDNDVEQ